MHIVSLAAITIVCGIAAVFFFMQSSRLRETIADLDTRAGEAETEARKQSDRAESIRRKLEAARNEASEKGQGGGARKRLNELKDEVKRQTAALDKVNAGQKTLERRARRAENRVEELQAVISGRGLKVPSEEDVAPPPPAPVAEPVTADPEVERRALRRAELDADKAERILEIERLRTQRELSQSERLAEEERAELAQLRDERDVMAERIMGTEQNLRIAYRKLEANRRAYIVTARKLELADDELFRLRGKTDEVPERKPLPTPEELAIELGAEEARQARKGGTKAAAKATEDEPAAAEAADSEATQSDDSQAAEAAADDDKPARKSRGTRKKAAGSKARSTKTKAAKAKTTKAKTTKVKTTRSKTAKTKTAKAAKDDAQAEEAPAEVAAADATAAPAAEDAAKDDKPAKRGAKGTVRRRRRVTAKGTPGSDAVSG